MTNVRSELAPAGADFSMCLPFRFGGPPQMFVEFVEAFTPESPVELEPFRRRLQPFRMKPAAPELPLALLTNEIGVLEHAQVTRNRRQRNGEGFRQLLDGRFSRREPRNDRSPCRVGERGKGEVQIRCVHQLAYRLIN